MTCMKKTGPPEPELCQECFGVPDSILVSATVPANRSQLFLRCRTHGLRSLFSEGFCLAVTFYVNVFHNMEDSQQSVE